ncbi:protein kinase domain-containing protein (plasmid) [Streptomyces sp. BI20]|uniref:serine/threonine-protein kinase n=1 Tax=Streptomyces sp. BI20 TaxID=3403460 RepID=UPI003C727B4D
MSAHLPGAPPGPEALSPDDPREIGGYRLRARLGAGGMGVVYLAHTPAGRPVAVKAIREEFAADPEFRERFAREVAGAGRINGLFTAQVVDFGTSARRPWLATVYVPGPSLHEVVRRHGPLPVRTVLLLLAGIAEALQAVHGAGVVHRDLKPANVLLAPDGPRVIDFGIAHAVGATALTGAGLRIGTAAFMAPEQAVGRAVTPATDVFALGALAVHVAGGAPPFGAGPDATTLYRVVHEAPDLARVPVELRGLLARCLAKDPGARPTTAQVIAEVRAHPAVGPDPGFGAGWLPEPVRAEVAGSGPGPAPDRPLADRTVAGRSLADRPLVDRTVAYGPPAVPAFATPRPPTVRVPVEAPVPVPSPTVPPVPRGARGRRSVWVSALCAAVLACCAGAAYWWFSGPVAPGADEDGEPAGSGHVAVYRDLTLTAPGPGWEFDLAAGKVVPAETAGWYLAWEGRAFVPSEASEAHVAEGPELSPAGCERGLGTRPVDTVPFAAAGERRPFCVRDPEGRRIAIVRPAGTGADGAVTVVVDQYTRE